VIDDVACDVEAACARRFDGQKRMVDRPKACADHQDQLRSDVASEVGERIASRERYQQAARTLDQENVGVAPGGEATRDQRTGADLDACPGGSDGGSERLLEPHRTDLRQCLRTIRRGTELGRIGGMELVSDAFAAGLGRLPHRDP